MTFRAVLFDLDGTLVDSAGDIAAALDGLLAEHGLVPLGVPAVRGMIGDGAATLVRRGFAGRGVAEPPADALARLVELYSARCAELTRPFPGIPELLDRLASRGALLAVVTNKPQSLSEQVLRELGLRQFTEIVGPERVSERKPAPAHVQGALRLLRADPGEAVMVGDMPQDVLSARAAGVFVVGCAWASPVEPLRASGADRIVGSVAELAALLEA